MTSISTLPPGPLDTGKLVALSTHRLRAEYSHYLVYPPRSERHPALQRFRSWLHAAAAEYVRTTADETTPRPRPAPRRRRRRP
ncbi:MAG TPA: hypothetical protein VFK02_16350 [Kofleriaceae bacterium]|nr:hypothetical protein [Kofleriaceae bacterium]